MQNKKIVFGLQWIPIFTRMTQIEKKESGVNPSARYFNKKNSLNIASIEDISSMKVIAIIQRGIKKDFSEVILIVKRNAISRG